MVMTMLEVNPLEQLLSAMVVSHCEAEIVPSPNPVQALNKPATVPATPAAPLAPPQASDIRCAAHFVIFTSQKYPAPGTYVCVLIASAS